MTSLNISLPEALKNYVEGQVASGDLEYPQRIHSGTDPGRTRSGDLATLEQELLAAARGPKIEVLLSEIRKNAVQVAQQQDPQQHFRVNRRSASLAIGIAQFVMYKLEADVPPHQSVATGGSSGTGSSRRK